MLMPNGPCMVLLVAYLVGGIGQRARTMQLQLLQWAVVCMLVLHIKQRWLSTSVRALHSGITTLACGAVNVSNPLPLAGKMLSKV